MMVSVIVCTYNREKYIFKALDALKKQTANTGEYEVVIVNNNSTDRTPEIIEGFIKESAELNVTYVIEKQQGHTFSRNRGIHESKGDILAFIDDDAFVYESYIEKIIQNFRTHKPDALGGKIIPVYEDSVEPKWMSKYLLPLVSALDMGSDAKWFPNRKFPIGANMAFRKEVFTSHGMFDVTLGRRGTEGLEGGDEKDVFLKIQRSGARILYAPDVKVDHIIPRKRVTIDYVRGLGIGVGTSERKRLKKSPAAETIRKTVSEMIKTAGTVILALAYSLKGRTQAGKMLIRFRFWVLSGLLKGEK